VTGSLTRLSTKLVVDQLVGSAVVSVSERKADMAMVAVPEREAMDRVTALGTRTVKCPGLCSVGTTTIEKYDNEGNDEDVKGGGGRAGEVDVCVCHVHQASPGSDFVNGQAGPVMDPNCDHRNP
jgi:hypothetical protein